MRLSPRRRAVETIPPSDKRMASVQADALSFRRLGDAGARQNRHLESCHT